MGACQKYLCLKFEDFFNLILFNPSIASIYKFLKVNNINIQYRQKRGLTIYQEHGQFPRRENCRSARKVTPVEIQVFQQTMAACPME
jgi:hypothetical protein